MNNQRRLQLAQYHIRLLKLIENIKQVYEDEKYAIEEIKSETTKEMAEEGHDKLDELVDCLNEAADLFEEAGQGQYNSILQKEQKRQQTIAEQQRQQTIAEQARAKAQEDAVRQQEIEYFLKNICPNPVNPHNWDIDSLDEFQEWKYYDTGRRNKYDEYVFEHTDAYKEYLNQLPK